MASDVWPDDDFRNYVLEQTKHALQAFAMPKEVQMKLYPPFAPPTVELVEHFTYCLDLLPQLSDLLTEEQWDMLRQINLQIDQLTESDYEDTDLETAIWEVFRTLAAQALTLFHWPIEAPPAAREVKHNDDDPLISDVNSS